MNNKDNIMINFIENSDNSRYFFNLTKNLIIPISIEAMKIRNKQKKIPKLSECLKKDFDKIKSKDYSNKNVASFKDKDFNNNYNTYNFEENTSKNKYVICKRFNLELKLSESEKFEEVPKNLFSNISSENENIKKFYSFEIPKNFREIIDKSSFNFNLHFSNNHM